MRQAIKEVFKFDELDESAKETAREWCRDGALDYDWWDSVYEDAKIIGRSFGLYIDDIYFTGFYHQGQGSAFNATYRYQKGGLKEVKAYGPQDKELHRIVKALQDAQRRNFYRLYATCKAKSDTWLSVDVEDSENSYRDLQGDDEVMADLLRDFNHWIFRNLEREYEWLMSDEQVDEAILANGYEFTEDGRHYI